jgi:hypothetical protein
MIVDAKAKLVDAVVFKNSRRELFAMDEKRRSKVEK